MRPSGRSRRRCHGTQARFTHGRRSDRRETAQALGGGIVVVIIIGVGHLALRGDGAGKLVGLALGLRLQLKVVK